MKEVKKDGRFKVKHEGIGVTVMFLEDYARQQGMTKYKVKKKVKDNELQELVIAGRQRMKSVVIVDYDKFTIFKNKVMSDSTGVFKVQYGRTYKDAMFVNQYAQKNSYNSKETLEYQLSKGILKGIKIQRLNGGYVNFVICEKTAA